MENEIKVDMGITELAEIVEDDKRHENTQLALKVNDGQKRIKRIMEFNQLVEQLKQQKEQNVQPPPQNYNVKPPQMATPQQVKQAKNPPKMTDQREKELDKKVAEAIPNKEPEAEDMGFPPLEEQEFFNEDETKTD